MTWQIYTGSTLDLVIHMYICNGNRTYSDIFYLFGSRYKQALTDTL